MTLFLTIKLKEKRNKAMKFMMGKIKLFLEIGQQFLLSNKKYFSQKNVI